MPLTTDFVLNNILKILPTIPFALISVQALYNQDEGYVFKLNYSWFFELRLFSDKAFLISDYGEAEEPDAIRAKILSVLQEMKLRMCEAIIVFDSEYQILNSYHFDHTGNVTYTFNSVRFSKDEVAIEYDIFATELDDKECLKDYNIFVETIKRDTVAQWVVLEEPALVQTIRMRKLNKILKE